MSTFYAEGLSASPHIILSATGGIQGHFAFKSWYAFKPKKTVVANASFQGESLEATFLVNQTLK